MEPTVLFEDEHLIALDKPELFHSSMLPSDHELVSRGISIPPSIAAWLYHHRPQCRDAGARPEDCGLVQRLDYETSGVIVAAKDRVTGQKLELLMREGHCRKRYIALLEGILRAPIELHAWIGDPGRKGERVTVLRDGPAPRTLPGHVWYQPRGWNRTFNLTLCSATTGSARRHQVRAFAAVLGHPLSGDTLYGGHPRGPDTAPGSTAPFFLRAESVAFEHPLDAVAIVIQAPLSSELTGLYPQDV